MQSQQTRRRIELAVVSCLLLAAFLWVRSQSDPAVDAVASLTNPEKLATLTTKRAANPRVLKCVYWLHEAKTHGRAPEAIIAKAQAKTDHQAAHAQLVKASLLRNLDIAEKLGCLTAENLDQMKRGRSPTITRGPYAGKRADVDHIVPVARAPELDKEIANLELLPASLNQSKGAKVGARQLDYLRRFVAAGIISEEAAERVRHSAGVE